MESNHHLLLRGFDIFFSVTSEEKLAKIAKQLGGRYSFNTKKGRATYMFKKIITIDFEQLSKVHATVNDLGRELAVAFSCNYIASELYVTTNSETAQLMMASGY